MRHKDIIGGVLYFLVILLDAITGLLTNVVASFIPEDLKPYQGWAVPLLGIVVLGQFVVANLLKRRQASSTMQSQPIPSETLEALRGVYDDYHMRLAFLKSVHEDYVKGRLLGGLHPYVSGTSISPPLIEIRNSIARPIPSEMSIKEFFGRTGGRLLILGDPGAGKTTLLLELTEALLTDLGSKNGNEPIIMPVFLNLQSWAEKRQRFGDWLVKALWETYGLASSAGKRWVDNDQLCLLLDGLDEMSEDHRAGCVAAINAYLREHEIASVVVCSRTAEYDDLVNTLDLQRTVIIRPLTDVQIETFLANRKEAVRVAHRKLHDDGDNEQRNRFRTPLMLEVLVVTYGEMTLAALERQGVPSTEQDVWKAYVDHMVNKHRVDEYKMDKYKGPKYKRPKPPYNIRQVQRWLGWLASYMHLHQQPEFYVEKLQPDWLSGWAEFSYKGLARLLSALGGSLFIGVTFAFLLGHDGNLSLALAGGLLFWLFGAAILAPAYGVDRIEPAEGFRLSRSGIGEGMIDAFRSVLSSSFGLWLILILLYGLVTLRFDVLGAYLVFWLIVGLLGALRGGLTIKPLEDAERARPNQGIWRSARSGVRAVLLVSLVLGIGGAMCGAWATVGSQLVDGLRSGAVLGLFLGLVLAPFTGMVGGWQACLLHLVLRLVLWGSGRIPANYVRFLDYASERVLLHKVGGRYIFVHRLLLEYFRWLDASSRRP